MILQVRDDRFLMSLVKIFKIEDVSLGIKKGRKIVYSGDTRPLNSMVEFAKNADVLIHQISINFICILLLNGI